MDRFDVEADRITTEWQHETGEYSISDWSCGELNKLIASALRTEAERAAKEERDECLKDARMYELGDNVNWDDPMAARQNQIAQAIIRMIESRGERKEAAIRARGKEATHGD